MSQKKLTLAAMAVCLAFCMAAPASAAQYVEIGRSSKDSAQVSQEVALTALIARYADPREGQWMASGIWENGDRTVREFMAGQRSWRQAFGFAYNPNLAWMVMSRDQLLIAWCYDAIGNKKMRYNNQSIGPGVNPNNATLEYVLQSYNRQLSRSDALNVRIIQSNWFGMAFAAASTNFAARVSEEISNQLAGNVFVSIDDAYKAVGQVLANIGDERLNEAFLSNLNTALLDSYSPLSTDMPGENAQTYPMLTHFQTGDGSVIRIGTGGWEHVKGTVLFGPGDGIIAGVPEKISISISRDSTFTTKGKGRK